MTHHNLMEYYDAPGVQPHAGPVPAAGGAKYQGAIAEGYDAKREQSPKWIVEQRIIEGLIAELPAGATVLDCPVGTGRFLKCYGEKGLHFVGLDISGDMLVQSALKLLPEPKVAEWVAASNQKNAILPLRLQNRGLLAVGDILQLPVKDKSVDAAVACRITRWIIGEHGPEGIVRMMRELQRVTKSRIILTARVANHRYAVTEDLIRSALDGWQITRNEAGYVTDYRVVVLEAV